MSSVSQSGVLTKDDGLRKRGRFGRHKFAERVSPSGPQVDAVAFRPLQVGLHFHLYTALASVWLDGAGSRVGSGPAGTQLPGLVRGLVCVCPGARHRDLVNGMVRASPCSRLPLCSAGF